MTFAAFENVKMNVDAKQHAVKLLLIFNLKLFADANVAIIFLR